jgi:hypothetical protein
MAVGYNFEKGGGGAHKDLPSQIWFNLVNQLRRRILNCNLLSKYV